MESAASSRGWQGKFLLFFSIITVFFCFQQKCLHIARTHPKQQHILRCAELIGGVRVVVGDEVLDTSVKARLEQMKIALTA